MARESDETHDMDGFGDGRPAAESVDRLIARIGGSQRGRVRRDQLVALGLGRGAIEHRLRCGRLHRVHENVYEVGHRRDDREARWQAAVLLGGDGAALSHRSGAAHQGLLEGGFAPIEVTVAMQRRQKSGIRFYRRELPPDEWMLLQGIPTTTVSRTLFDLVLLLPARRYARVLREAEVRGLGDRTSLTDLLARYPGRRGAGRIRAAMERQTPGATFVPSELEGRFLSLTAAAGFPMPAQHYGIALRGDWLEVDFAWPELQVVVELDGRRFHDTPAAFERDRERDRKLQAAGWRVIRITWRQLHDEPASVIRDLRNVILAAQARA